jgi:Subtilase family
MPDIAIDVAIDTSVLVLDYEPAAHTQLAALDPAAGAAWDSLVAAVGALSLDPLFGSVPKETLADLLDAGRIAGNDPPDLMAWFQVVVDEALVPPVLIALQSLFFVAHAEPRSVPQLAAVVTWNTNPEARDSIAIDPGSVGGVDAKYAWQVDGGTGERITLADIEYGWDLTHEDLAGAQITKPPMGPETDIDHGTGVAGILVAPDNGVGIVGIVPSARLLAFNLRPPARPPTLADAIFYAGATLRVGAKVSSGLQGDVVLIPLGEWFRRLNGKDGLVPIEYVPAVRQAIHAVTALGITVIEAAGNTAVDLDAEPGLARMNPGNPQFVDSGAVVVGAGQISATGAPERASQSDWGSSFGARVDCFAVSVGIRAPGPAPSNYHWFAGTSGASTVIAGVVAAIQAMSFAHDGKFFAPAVVRDILRNPDLCTAVGPSLPGRIRGMPDLRLIAQSFGWARILPPAVATTNASTLFLVTIDPQGHLTRRNFVQGAGWTAATADDPTFFSSGQTPALTVSNGPDGIVFDAFAAGADEALHHQSWDGALNVTGTLPIKRTPKDTITADRALVATRTDGSLVKVAGIDHDGRLTVASGDAPYQFATGMDTVSIDYPATTFRASAGPAIVSRAAGQADVVAVDDAGRLRATHFDLSAATGSGWTIPMLVVPGATCDPKARPAITGDPTSVAAVAVGTDGFLYAAQATLAALPILSPLAMIDPSQVPVSRLGPAAIVLTDSDQLMALAVGEDLCLRFSLKRVGAAAWSPLTVVDPDVICSPLGGVSAVAFGPAGVAAVVVGIDGEPLWASWDAVADWTALHPTTP